ASPPYLGVMKYAKLNWIRHWLLDQEPRQVDARLFASSSLSDYISFIRDALRHLTAVLRPDGFVCLVIGDVRRGDREIRLAEHVASESVRGTGLRVVGLIADELPVEHKVSRIWKAKKGRATRVDRFLVLSASNARLPRCMPSIHW